MSDRVLSIDFETASLLDLRKVGASRYSRDPSTRVTVMAWAFDEEDVQSMIMPPEACFDEFPQEIVEHIAAGGAIQAWNAFFEFCFLQNYFCLPVLPEQMSCTMQRSLVAGLPASLDDAGDALRLDMVKDRSARQLMLQMARPRSRKPLTWWHETDEGKLARLRAYCEQDVRAERAIGDAIPQLSQREKKISDLDRRANLRGVRLDVDLIKKMMAIAEEETRHVNERVAELTDGAVTSVGTQSARLASWLQDHGAEVEGVGKDEILEALKVEDLEPEVAEVLRLRQLVAKSSTKKLQAMLDYMDDDQCVRGMLKYYGAARTGRWSGAGPQPQNYPRPTIKTVDLAIAGIKAGMDAEGLEIFHGSPMEVIASCLRGCLIPRPGKVFIAMDLSQIEARMVAWLSGQKDTLAVFASGEDVYRHMAKKLGSDDRQLGKVVVLAAGYGMGAEKFQATAAKAPYFIDLSLERSQEILTAFREAADKISGGWRALEATARQCLQHIIDRPYDPRFFRVPNMLCTVSARQKRDENILTLELPSGRRLVYRHANFGTPREGWHVPPIIYAGQHQKTKQWVEDIQTYGGHLVQNITQAAARDVMADMMMAIDEIEGCDVLLSIHDEIIVEADADRADEILRKVEEAMNTAPDWCVHPIHDMKGDWPALPVKAEGGILQRYGK